MVQPPPNDSTVHGTIKGSRPDPSRPGWVVLDVAVDAGATIEGEDLPALAQGADVQIVARESEVEAITEGDSFSASVRMTGPGDYLARDLTAAPAPDRSGSGRGRRTGRMEEGRPDPVRRDDDGGGRRRARDRDESEVDDRGV